MRPRDVVCAAVENPVTTTQKIRAAAADEYAQTLLRNDRMDGAVALCTLLLESSANVPAMFRSGAEKGIVDALRQWCIRSGCPEGIVLQRLRKAAGREITGL